MLYSQRRRPRGQGGRNRIVNWWADPEEYAAVEFLQHRLAADGSFLSRGLVLRHALEQLKREVAKGYRMEVTKHHQYQAGPTLVINLMRLAAPPLAAAA
jgi:hypothetical protein